MYEKIVKFCEERKVTIAAFERICGFKRGYVEKLKGSRQPGVRFAKRAAEVMGISVEELIGNEE